MIFGINTTRDISKLSQISLAWRLVKLRITKFWNITRGNYAKYHYTNHAITYTNFKWKNSFKRLVLSISIQIRMLLRYIFLGGDFVWWRRDQIPFTLHEIPVALAPSREPYQIGLLITQELCFLTIVQNSCTKWTCLLQDSEFPVDSRINPQLAHHRGPSAHLTRSGGFRLTHTINAHNLPVSG